MWRSELELVPVLVRGISNFEYTALLHYSNGQVAHSSVPKAHSALFMYNRHRISATVVLVFVCWANTKLCIREPPSTSSPSRTERETLPGDALQVLHSDVIVRFYRTAIAPKRNMNVTEAFSDVPRPFAITSQSSHSGGGYRGWLAHEGYSDSVNPTPHGSELVKCQTEHTDC